MSESFKLSCPSKTFLLGEYLVLNDGPALLINTEPRFELSVKANGKGQILGIPHDSPAGIWLRNNRLLFEKYDLEFIDPHNKMGGFGASSAQFMLIHVALQKLKTPQLSVEETQNFKIEQIWRMYRNVETISSEGLRPSGADLVSQFCGSVCEFQPEPFMARSFHWPLEDHEVVFAHTGRKMATHEHLRGLKRVNTEELALIYARALETLTVHDAQAFFDSVNDYYAELLELGLVSEPTQVSVAKLIHQNYVRAAKGCGAMGSDVIAIIIPKEQRAKLNSLLVELGLKYVSDSKNISKGILFHEIGTTSREKENSK